ncbi:hypothetical protein [Demequina salsinemoris]|nr:hypothetical protein [Demequina salsinemoris]
MALSNSVFNFLAHRSTAGDFGYLPSPILMEIEDAMNATSKTDIR